MAEMVYFLIHEHPPAGRFIENLHSRQNKNKLIQALKKLHAGNGPAIYGRRFHSLEEKNSYIEESVNFFARALSEMQAQGLL